MIRAIEFLYLAFWVVVDNHPKRTEHSHHAGSLYIEVLPNAVLKQG
jgi:hypothetical protein